MSSDSFVPDNVLAYNDSFWSGASQGTLLTDCHWLTTTKILKNCDTHTESVINQQKIIININLRWGPVWTSITDSFFWNETNGKVTNYNYQMNEIQTQTTLYNWKNIISLKIYRQLEKEWSLLWNELISVQEGRWEGVHVWNACKN